jgi:hypothetical protein
METDASIQQNRDYTIKFLKKLHSDLFEVESLYCIRNKIPKCEEVVAVQEIIEEMVQEIKNGN